MRRLLVESNKHWWSLLKTDVKNAFNSIRRSYLMQMVYKSFPEIYNVFQMYSDSNPLIYTNGKTVSTFSSEEGIHQGDPLGPAIFSITIQYTLLEL